MTWLRANILYGLIALVPVGILAIVGYYIYSAWLILLPASEQLGLTTTEARVLALVLAIPAFLIICLVLGILVRTRIGTLSFGWLETRVLSQIPGYGVVANLLRGFADKQSSFPAALVTMGHDGIGTLAFVMEDDGGPTVTIFVPMAPMMTLGNIYRVDRARVEMLPHAAVDTAGAVSQWGIGLGAIVTRARTLSRM